MNWRELAVKRALSDLARCIVESDPAGADWINKNIIQPVWGPSGNVTNTQYCGDTVASWWHMAGLPSPKGLSSPGKIRYNFAGKDKRGEVIPVAHARPGDAILHQLPKPKHWNGHVMMALAVTSTHVLICEGNHGCSIGPSLKGYQPGKKKEDQTRRQGIGIRWLRLDDPYLACAVAPHDSEFGE